MRGGIADRTTRRTRHGRIITSRTTPAVPDVLIDIHLRHPLRDPLLRATQRRAGLPLGRVPVTLRRVLRPLRGEMQPVADTRLFRFGILPLQRRVVFGMQSGGFRDNYLRRHGGLAVAGPVDELIVGHFGGPGRGVELLAPGAHLPGPPVGRFGRWGAGREAHRLPQAETRRASLNFSVFVWKLRTGG